MNDKIIIAGGAVGIIAVLLFISVSCKHGLLHACFIRIAGGIGMHRAEVVRKAQPEVIGLYWGAFLLSLKTKISNQGRIFPLHLVRLRNCCDEP